MCKCSTNTAKLLSLFKKIRSAQSVTAPETAASYHPRFFLVLQTLFSILFSSTFYQTVRVQYGNDNDDDDDKDEVGSADTCLSGCDTVAGSSY